MDRNSLDENKRKDVVKYLIRGMRKTFSAHQNTEQQSGGREKFISYDIIFESNETGQVSPPKHIPTTEVSYVGDIKSDCKATVQLLLAHILSAN